jgi:hypothetical protein
VMRRLARRMFHVKRARGANATRCACADRSPP